MSGSRTTRPGALAISSSDGTLSYAELEQLSRHLAALIDQARLGRRDVVAILADRGARVVVAALACARAGRPFVILDLAYPAQRLAALTELCRPKLLLLAGNTGSAPGLDLPSIRKRLSFRLRTSVLKKCDRLEWVGHGRTLPRAERRFHDPQRPLTSG